MFHYESPPDIRVVVTVDARVIDALEAVAVASEVLMDCLCEFGQDNNAAGVWYCAERYQVLADKLAVLAVVKRGINYAS